MKKTKIIALLCSVLITGICFYLCREMISSRIIPVSFSVESNISDEFIFTVIYSNDEKNQNKNKTETRINLKENELKSVNIQLPLPEGKLQNFSLSIKSKDSNGFKIRLKDFKIRHLDVFKKYSLDQISLSDTVAITIEQNNNNIINLSCKIKEGRLSIKDKLNLKSNRDWGICASVIFFIIVFSSGYIVLKFLINTRIIQKEHTANIVFVIVLFLTLFIPASKIDTQTIKNTNENRVLAQYKKLFSGNPFEANSLFNYSYGKNFESWFNDRFRGREKIVSFINDFKYKLSFKVFKNRDGYRYNDWVWLSGEWINSDQDNLKKIANTLNEIYINWKIPVIVLVYPAKSEIYCNYSLSRNCPFGSDKIYNYLQKNLKSENIKVISVLPYALKHKNDKELLYYKDEHHMTQYGNQVLIDELISDGYLPKSQNEYKQYTVKAKCTWGEFAFDKDYCEKHYIYGQSYGFIRGNNKRGVIDNNMNIGAGYVYYGFSNKYKTDIRRKHTLLNNKNVGYTNIYNNNRNVFHFTPLQIGNSFVETLSIALSTRYDHVIRFRLNSGNPGKSIFDLTEEILKDKPNIIIATIYKDKTLRYPCME